MAGKSFTKVSSLLFCLFAFNAITVIASHVDKRAPACLQTQAVKLIQSGLTHPNYFCSWYIRKSSSETFIAGLSAAQLKSACSCITGAKPMALTAPGLFSTVPCDNLRKLVQAETIQPALFCKAWTKSSDKTASPLKTLPNPKKVDAACTCILSSSTSSAVISSKSGEPSSVPSAVSSSGTVVTPAHSGTSTKSMASIASRTLSSTPSATGCAAVPTGPYYIKVSNSSIDGLTDTYFHTRFGRGDYIRVGPYSSVPGESTQSFYYDACMHTLYIKSGNDLYYLASHTKANYHPYFYIASKSDLQLQGYTALQATIDQSTMAVLIGGQGNTSVQSLYGNYNPCVASDSPLAMTAVPVSAYKAPPITNCTTGDLGPYYLAISNTSYSEIENSVLKVRLGTLNGKTSYDGTSFNQNYVGNESYYDSLPLLYNTCGGYFRAANSTLDDPYYWGQQFVKGSGTGGAGLCENDGLLDSCQLATNCTLDTTTMLVDCNNFAMDQVGVVSNMVVIKYPAIARIPAIYSVKWTQNRTDVVIKAIPVPAADLAS